MEKLQSRCIKDGYTFLLMSDGGIMADTHDIDVFSSYDHNDRGRVRLLVDEVRRNGWAV
jgi:hypothetical protein